MVNHPRRSRAKTAASSVVVLERDHDGEYATFRGGVQASFNAATASGKRLFTTDVPDLFPLYLAGLPDEAQVHNCTACRRFVNHFGGLVIIDDDGKSVPAAWMGEVPHFYTRSVTTMQAAIRKARVVGPFLTSDMTLGTPVTGVWSHLAAELPASMKFRHALLSPNQAMAARREDFRTVASALADFTPDILAEAMRLLTTASLQRSEHFIGSVKWLQDIHAARATTKDARTRDNLLWTAIASAPEGYCHPRASVVGSLLEDIAGGLAFEDVRKRFNAKMHPLQYQRPQAAPSAGSIAAAEKVFEQMGLAPALERRYARLDDLEAAWTPAAIKASPQGGIFGHLKPKDATFAPALDIPPVTMTWEKFSRTVLSDAQAMDLLVPARGNFIGLTSAVHADAPPILKWDQEDHRNPVAWYVYHNGSGASDWAISAGWRKVNAVVPLPPMWGDNPQPHLGEGMVLIVDGMVDQRLSGLALFPECLRAELHGVRSVIEAHSRTGKLQGHEEASAAGYDIRKGSDPNCVVRTLTDGRWTSYHIDRWD